jgi:hypothetical protein
MNALVDDNMTLIKLLIKCKLMLITATNVNKEFINTVIRYPYAQKI